MQMAPMVRLQLRPGNWLQGTRVLEVLCATGAVSGVLHTCGVSPRRSRTSCGICRPRHPDSLRRSCMVLIIAAVTLPLPDCRAHSAASRCPSS